MAPYILKQFMQGSTVFYPTLPSQPSVRKVYLKYLSTSLHQPVFEVSLKRFFADSSFGSSAVLSLFSIAEQPVFNKNFHWRHVDARFQCCQSLVGCFILHPETSASKGTTNERKDGLIEGRKSTKRWDFKELTEAIFQCNFTIVCRQCQTHRKTKVSGKLPE